MITLEIFGIQNDTVQEKNIGALWRITLNTQVSA